MNIEELLEKVNSRLDAFFNQYHFELKEPLRGLSNGEDVLLWHNKEFIIKIYSLPYEGEINCQIARAATSSCEIQNVWKYLYEVSPLTSSELMAAHTSFRSADQQLDSICRKLIDVFATGKIKQTIN